MLDIASRLGNMEHSPLVLCMDIGTILHQQLDNPNSVITSSQVQWSGLQMKEKEGGGRKRGKRERERERRKKGRGREREIHLCWVVSRELRVKVQQISDLMSSTYYKNEWTPLQLCLWPLIRVS